MLNPSARPRRPSAQTRVNFGSSELYDLLVPAKHPLRQLNEHLDLSFVRGEIKKAGIYCQSSGRYGLEPELFIRVSLLQALYGVSDRGAVLEASANLVWKYFLGLEVDELAPFDDTTLGKTRQRYSSKHCLALVQAQIKQALEGQYLDAEKGTHFIDSALCIADAAVVKGIELVRRVCEKLREALRPVLEQAVVQRLAETDEALRKDTSWYLSSELKQASLKQWSEHCAELVALAEQLLMAPGLPGTLGEWERHEKRISRQLAIAQHLLADQAPKAKGEPKDKLASETDPEARRSGRSSDGNKLGYRMHLELDEDSGLVVSVTGTAGNCEDGTALQQLVEQAEQQGVKPAVLAADSAYADGANRQLLEEHNIEAHIPQPRPKPSKKGYFLTTEFAYNAVKRTVTCPAGTVCSNWRENKRKGGMNFYYPLAKCAACPLHAKCVGEEPKHGRAVYIAVHRGLTDRAREQQQTAEHKAVLRRRMKVEHKLQRMLNVTGMRHCRYRGLERFQIQLALATLLINSEQLARLKRRREQEGGLQEGPSQAA